jgi:cardiolipin synthase A/B
MDSTGFHVIAIIAIILQSLIFFLALFGPRLRYRILSPASTPTDSKQFFEVLERVANAAMTQAKEIEALTNGNCYYEAELKAIREAKKSINIEAYIFQRGEIAKRFVEALTERAKAGVCVKIVLDALGCLTTTEAYLKPLLEAGGKVGWYHPFRWYKVPRINNRTHREIIVIDGETGFIGGSGVADHWWKGKGKDPPWRDTMFRVTGEAVCGLQTVFAENWLDVSGEILNGEDYYPSRSAKGIIPVMVLSSTPSVNESTRARILYQTLLASAQKSIFITTPYFLPDRGVREEMIKAIRERDVEIKVIAPGKKTDHLLTRRSSRRLFGDLLKAGAKIYEYKPSMIHAKIMIIDHVWSIVGSTNFDSRSFVLNDESNLVVFDETVAERLSKDFAADLANCQDITYEKWQKRPIYEKVQEWFGWVLERQQ